ncbi:MAG: transcription antitermination factor NusB [bacterium]|jgi:N utilization substance protein B
MGSRRDARESAVQILFQLDFNPGELNTTLASYWLERKVTTKTQLFVEELVRGVMENRFAVDATIAKCAQNWELPRMATVDRNVIRLAVYEMMFRKDIPHAVSINEAVAIAKNMGDVGSGRFVNGVLDKVHRDIEASGVGKTAGEAEGTES